MSAVPRLIVHPKDRQVCPRAVRVANSSWPYIVLGGERMGLERGRSRKGWGGEGGQVGRGQGGSAVRSSLEGKG